MARPALLLALLALVGSGCLGPVAELYPPRPGEPVRTIYLVGHGWHAGLVIARADIPDAIWPEHREFPAARWLEIGWGDRAFYRSPEPTLGLALRAAFASEGSVLHVAGFDRAPAEYFPRAEIVAIDLSRQAVEALARFIHEAYARDAEGRPVVLGPGLYPLSRFYAARGRYHLIRTCNNWTAETLRAAGCPITPAYAVVAGNLMLQAESCGRILDRGR
ncbi:MAG TPA: TIGR02117 family protein [Methylomirabilota bacterium]|nr:TIGR02117 family protein [Methylomirabilota bacterium]